jgi:hypothetical protein
MLACGVCGQDFPRCGHQQLPDGAPGVKHDAGKLRWSALFPWDGAAWVMLVLEFGAKKYAPNNWRRLTEGGYERCVESAMGHLVDASAGEERDPESNLPHLAHAVCQLLFALALRHGKPASTEGAARGRGVAG